MAAYELKFPDDVQKYTELAFIAKQLRYHEKVFIQYKDPMDELEAMRFRQLMDYWLADNLLKIKKTE